VALGWMLLGSGTAALGAAAGWPMVQGGASHPGDGGSATVDPPLTEAWRVSDGANGRLSAPVVGDGVAVAVGVRRVIAFDPVAGEVSWAVSREAGALDPAALAGSDGALGQAVVVEGSDPATSAIRALALEDGSELWRTELGAVSRGGPTVAADQVIVSTITGQVRSFDVATGAAGWTSELGGRVLGAPTVDGDLVFAVSEDLGAGSATLYALDLATGTTTWSVPRTEGARASGLTVAGGTVFVGFGDRTVCAFEAATGSLVWSTPVRFVFSPQSLPAVADGRLYVADRIGSLYALDATTGEQLWDYQFPSQALIGSPLVAGSVVYLGQQDGTLAAMDVASGDLVWQTTFAGGWVGSLAPAGALLLVPGGRSVPVATTPSGTPSPSPSGEPAATGGPGGIHALAHDANGTLESVSSPTRLRPVEAGLNFALAFVAILAGTWVLFGLILRPRGARALPWRRGRTSDGEEEG
jgi:eukaryotic-like serine/threonine-protein kinase